MSFFIKKKGGKENGIFEIVFFNIFVQIEESQRDQSGAQKLEVCDLVDLIGVEGKNNSA